MSERGELGLVREAMFPEGVLYSEARQGNARWRLHLVYNYLVFRCSGVSKSYPPPQLAVALALLCRRLVTGHNGDLLRKKFRASMSGRI